VCFYNVTPSKGTTNQPIGQVQWDMFKVLKFCQPNALNHSFSSSLLSKWPNPSWTPSHFVTKHGPYLIHTFVKTLIFVFWMTLKPFLMNSMSSLERQTEKHTSSKLRSHYQGSHLNVGVHIQIQIVGLWHLMRWSNIHEPIFRLCNDMKDLH
jgi:hypothetical protein